MQYIFYPRLTIFFSMTIDQIFYPAFPLGSDYNGTTYVWHQKAEATCFASFVCQELGENPCGEYNIFGQVRAVCLDGFSDHCIFVSPYHYY